MYLRVNWFGKKADMQNFTVLVLCDFDYKDLVKQEPKEVARNAAETWNRNLQKTSRIRVTAHTHVYIVHTIVST
jgi:hypothetical protein